MALQLYNGVLISSSVAEGDGAIISATFDPDTSIIAIEQLSGFTYIDISTIRPALEIAATAPSTFLFDGRQYVDENSGVRYYYTTAAGWVEG